MQGREEQAYRGGESVCPHQEGCKRSLRNKAGLESHLEGLTDETNSLTQLYEEQVPELLSQIPDPSGLLALDESCSLGLYGLVTEVNVQHQEIASHSQAEAKSCNRPGMRSCRPWLGRTGMTSEA